jgi:hypothetical protein
MPVASLPVPSPNAVEPTADNTRTQTPESNSEVANGVSDAQGGEANNRIVPSVRAGSDAQDKAPTQGVRITPALFEAAIDTADRSLANQSLANQSLAAQVQAAEAPAVQSPETQANGSTAASTASPSGSSQAQNTAPAPLPLNGTALTGIAFLPDTMDAGASATNAATSSKTGNPNLSAVAGTQNASNAIGNARTSSAASTNTSAHADQNSVQGNTAAQHTQGDASQTAPVTAKSADITASQIQTVVAPGATHEATPTHSRADASTELRSSDQPAQADVHDNTATQGINTANVIQKMNETEMRVGMHSAEFGEISIRTSVSQQQMTAQISVDHGDLGKAISAHIPAMEAKLGGDFGLRALVQVNQSGMSFSGERGYSPQREQRPFVQAAQAEGVSAITEIDSAAPRLAAVAGDGYRLDIRA